MAETPKCTSWFGHKFEARLSSEPRDGDFPLMMAEGKHAIDAQVRMRCAVTYECDICTRCGFVVERKPPTKSTD